MARPEVDRAHAIVDEAVELRVKLKAVVWRLPPETEALAREVIAALERRILVYGYVAATAAMLPDKPPAARGAEED